MPTPFEILKFNLQERQFPYFEEAELQILLDNNEADVKKASYQGCIMKAQDDSVNVGPIKTGSNREYWLTLANQFKPAATTYNSSMKRADEA